MKLTEGKKRAFVGLLVAAMGIAVLLLLYSIRFAAGMAKRRSGSCTAISARPLWNGRSSAAKDVSHVRISVGESFDNDFLWDEETRTFVSRELSERFSVDVSFSDTAVTEGKYRLFVYPV